MAGEARSEYIEITVPDNSPVTITHRESGNAVAIAYDPFKRQWWILEDGETNFPEIYRPRCLPSFKTPFTGS